MTKSPDFFFFFTLFSICLSLSLLKFLRLFDELIQGVEAILAAGHMGVIVQLAESCAESEEKQDELMQCLLRVSATGCLLSRCYSLRGALFLTLFYDRNKRAKQQNEIT